MTINNVYKLLDDRIKKYENIIEELKGLNASENCIMSVIQDYQAICETKNKIRQAELEEK